MMSLGRALFVAAAAVAVAAGLRVLLGLVLPTDLSFTAMLPAIMVAALAGGPGAGLIATVLGGIVAQWAFVEPYYVFGVPSFTDVGNLIAYGLLAGMVLWAAGVYEKARRRAESNAAAAARLASIVTNSADAIIGFDRSGTVEDWNAGAERLFGYTADEITGRPGAVLLSPVGDGSLPAAPKLLSKDSARFTSVWTDRSGRRIDVAVTTGPVHMPDGEWIGVAAIVRDISREVASEQALREANRRNVLLLSQIHQRMRDSLEIVAALIATCARQLENETGRRQILGLEKRVAAISRIHDHLHRSADFGTVEIGAVLRQVVGDLVGLAGRPADMEIIGEAEVRLRSDLAVPVVFAATELVTNALTHAGCARPIVRVRSGRRNGALVLTVADNGRGVPPGFDPASQRGLGLRLAGAAIERIGGTLALVPSDSGACFEVLVRTAPEPAELVPTDPPRSAEL
ncbi:sensor histidine kinase [Rhodoplanes roseus]|nr:PAS domain S-box protein [Rhodoplanes roseus]